MKNKDNNNYILLHKSNGGTISIISDISAYYIEGLDRKKSRYLKCKKYKINDK